MRIALLALTATRLIKAEDDTKDDELAQLVAQYEQCQKNHADVYPSAKQPPQCPFFFERDSSTSYYCADKSSIVSKSVEADRQNPSDKPDFYTTSSFITRSKAPDNIECGRVLLDQSDLGFGEGTACLQGDEFDKTKINSNIRNFRHADFLVPQYQSSACCSSHARFGFGYQYDQYSGVNDPFEKTEIQFNCYVQRRSYLGDTCGSFRDGYSVFGGTTSCTTSYSGDINNGAVVLESMADKNNFTVHEKCSLNKLQADCETYSTVGDPNTKNPDCNSELSFSQQFAFYNYCSYLPQSESPTKVILQEVPSPILDEIEMADCTKCRALKDAMSGFPCSPMQGNFVSEGKFRVCKSACETMLASCGLPVHRGGLFTTAKFDSDGAWKGDYSDATSLCEAMWNPDPKSVWAREGITLEVVEDSTPELRETCVGFERAVYNINKDTQDFVFDYEAIRDNEGFCVLEDPLFDATNPCYDLEEEVQTRRRRLMEGGGNGGDSERSERRRLGEKANGGTSMYNLNDAERGDFIADGWPYERTNAIDWYWWLLIAVGSVIALVIVFIIVSRSCKKRL